MENMIQVLRETCRDNPDKKAFLVKRAEQQIHPSDVEIIIYTSGTTGPPKGACLTHKIFLAELSATDLLEEEHVGDITMFFLTLSHVGERIGQFMRIRHEKSAEKSLRIDIWRYWTLYMKLKKFKRSFYENIQ